VTGPAAGAPSPSLSVVLANDARGLAEHVPAWEALAEAALEPNVFYEPWMLLPAWERFRDGADVRFVLVYAADPAQPGGRALCGFFPLERRARFQVLPVPVLRMWRHKHCFFCAPLLRQGHAREALDRFFEWLRRDAQGAPLFQWTMQAGEGPFHDLLSERTKQRATKSFMVETHPRALFKPGADAETYLAAAFSGDRRRNLKRKERRLADLAPVRYETLDPAGDVKRWIEAFLAIEKGGWKGKEGTALDCTPEGRSFFETIVGEGARGGRLLFFALWLGEEPIAMSCYFRAGRGGFWFKPAFDERYARSSPGLLLKVEITRQFHEIAGLAWVDSCTAADNAMMNDLWPDRRSIVSLVQSTGRGVGDMVVAMLPTLRTLNRRLKRGREARPAEGAPAKEREGAAPAAEGA